MVFFQLLEDGSNNSFAVHAGTDFYFILFTKMIYNSHFTVVEADYGFVNTWRGLFFQCDAVFFESNSR